MRNLDAVMNKQNKGVVLVILSAVGFAVMPIFALYAYRGGINVPTILFIRFALSAVLLFAWLRANGQQVTVSRRQTGALFVMGGILYALISTCYFSALHYITPSLTVLLMYTYPIIVALLTSLVEKEPLNKNVLIPVVMSFFGLVLVLGTSFENISLIGVFLAFGSGVVYSCYIVLGNRLVREMPSTLTSAWVALFAAFSFLVTGLAHDIVADSGDYSGAGRVPSSHSLAETTRGGGL